MNGDPIVYDAGGKDYVGHFGGDSEGWYRWPATEDGWKSRKVTSAPTAGRDMIKLEPKNARLALRFSGVE